VAKEKGRGTHAVFEPSMFSTTLEAMSLKTDLRKALQADEFVLHYQPLLNLNDGTVAGFEALVRWHHPARGLLSPADFIAIAEESGLIVDMGRRLLFRACAQAQGWRETFSPTLKMSFNLSAKQLRDGALAESVAQALDASRFPAENLVLEVTENLLMQDVEATVARLRGFRDTGIRIAIDDFGTGRSSLGLLRELPIDLLKVDRTFVQGMTQASRDVAFVEAILRLARSLQLDTIAEGVETQEQAELLRQLGCSVAQGYLFAKPMDPTDAELFLATRPAADATSEGLALPWSARPEIQS
jgi:EAL domain-containing protein (putative c-di-GMP-specific phosphodiesterase class I)